MLFYVHNEFPNRTMSLEKIEEILLERFQVYCLNTNFHYDTEDFHYNDAVAHLMMALITIDFPHFRESYINGEVVVFREKLKLLDSSEIKKEISTAIEYFNYVSQNENLKLGPKQMNKLQLVDKILQIMYNKSSHVFHKSHPKRCRKLKMNLPFTFLLKLVGRKEVEVSNGKVGVSCGDWHKILEIVFEVFLETEINFLSESEEIKEIVYGLEDDRFRQIIGRFTNFLSGNADHLNKDLKAENLNEESRYFPPCMANLHQILKKTHRLSYDSRYQYTLFLKDIGLPVDENIKLWKTEYSKPAVGSSCTHEWEEKKKRYEYQIQHLYGLIGTRGLKTSHSCDKFINDFRNKMNAGCPFEHLTVENLKNAIPERIMELPDVEDIFKYKSRGLPQKACAAYLHCQKKLLLLNENYVDDEMCKNQAALIISPLYYYNTAKNICG